MIIVVVGGSGLIASKLVATLTRDGHEVAAASRRSGFDAVTATVDGEIGRVEVPLAHAILSD
jgi:uncharacterized protein YbjT (DUF2867 family)